MSVFINSNFLIVPLVLTRPIKLCSLKRNFLYLTGLNTDYLILRF